MYFAHCTCKIKLYLNFHEGPILGSLFIGLTLSDSSNGYNSTVSYESCACILALVGSHANRMRRIIRSHVAIWLCHIFPHYLINGMIFGKKVSEHKICIDFLYYTCLKHFSF